MNRFGGFNIWLTCLLMWGINAHYQQLPLVVAQDANSAPPSNGGDPLPEIVAQAERGLSGSLLLNCDDPSLRVKVQRDVDAPLVVRLHKLADSSQYEVQFIGTREGTFDLRDSFERADGSSASDLAPMFVRVVSPFAKEQRSDLFESGRFEPNLVGGYRLAAYVLMAIWLLLPLLLYVAKRLGRAEVVLPPPVEQSATLADQIEQLVLAAANRSLSTLEKGRLELLLIHYWRERAEIPGLSMASSIQRLREHVDAGPLIRAIELWLHHSKSSPTIESNNFPPEIRKLLEPYRSIRAIDPESLDVEATV